MTNSKLLSVYKSVHNGQDDVTKLVMDNLYHNIEEQLGSGPDDKEKARLLIDYLGSVWKITESDDRKSSLKKIILSLIDKYEIKVK